MEEEIKEIRSEGFKKCEKLIEIMKKFNQEEFSEVEIKKFVAKHIGFSKLSRDRYFFALLDFGFIKKLENGNYAIS